MSKIPPVAKVKEPLWTTIRRGWRPYKRLYSYALPYKWRFVAWHWLRLSLRHYQFAPAAGHGEGSLRRLQGTRRHGPDGFGGTPGTTNSGPKINSLILLCLAIPAVMTMRSLCSYANAYYMNWVSNKVLTDIRTQLFSKMIRQSMDFFNKMQSGFLMSQITNNTRMMQTALSSISSDLFKQPIAIIGGISVLLYMDWKFTIVTLVLFPSCLVPLSMYGKRARKAVSNEQDGHGRDGRDDAGEFRRHSRDQIFRARGATGKGSFAAAINRSFPIRCAFCARWKRSSPLVETIAAMGVALALLYVYLENLPAAKFIALIGGIFLLYEPIKTLSRMHITMQRSIASTINIFDSPGCRVDRPRRPRRARLASIPGACSTSNTSPFVTAAEVRTR